MAKNVVSAYKNYQVEVAAEIESLMADLACQPIIFAGSGLSRRYISSPNWDDLLKHLCKECAACDKDYAYYRQKFTTNPLVATELAKIYHEWAWGSGKNEFPKDLYSTSSAVDAFLKYRVASHIKSITPGSINDIVDSGLREEISLLQDIRPHAVLTTNYDNFLELIFPDYHPVIGSQILRSQSFSVGEVLKIHGCVSDPASMILTNEDYSLFLKKKKYLSAKLLTYFSEHPVIILGYSAEDPNIRSILSDIDEALPMSGEVIRNIYFVDWMEIVDEGRTPPKEKLLAIDDAKSVRVKSITANDFRWVFETFKSPETISKVSAKTLRALLVRSYELVRHDIPRKTLEVNFSMLEGAVENSGEFAKLFGIATISSPTDVSARYPHSLSDVGIKLGFPGWQGVQKLIDKVKKNDGFDIKASDNAYQATVKIGKNTLYHKYSDEAVNLLMAVKDCKSYKLKKPK